METISREEAVEKGFLEQKKVFLKPVPRGGKMITSPEHVAYFQMEGASNWFQLPLNRDTGALVNPFRSDEEKAYFEKALDTDLNVHKKKDNFWKTFFVKVIKDYNLMHNGYEFDLSDPLDNLRYRVVKSQPSVAPSWEKRHSRGEYRFALVEEGYQDKADQSKADKLVKIYTHIGSIQNSATKMGELLGIYLMETRADKLVPADATKDWLKAELNKAAEKDLSLFLQIIEDPDAKTKSFILDGIRAGAIVKQGVNKYNVPGEGVSYTYPELVDYLKKAEEIKSDVYLKMVAQIKQDKK